MHLFSVITLYVSCTQAPEIMSVEWHSRSLNKTYASFQSRIQYAHKLSSSQIHDMLILQVKMIMSELTS